MITCTGICSLIRPTCLSEGWKFIEKYHQEWKIIGKVAKCYNKESIARHNTACVHRQFEGGSKPAPATVKGWKKSKKVGRKKFEERKVRGLHEKVNQHRSDHRINQQLNVRSALRWVKQLRHGNPKIQKWSFHYQIWAKIGKLGEEILWLRNPIRSGGYYCRAGKQMQRPEPWKAVVRFFNVKILHFKDVPQWRHVSRVYLLSIRVFSSGAFLFHLFHGFFFAAVRPYLHTRKKDPKTSLAEPSRRCSCERRQKEEKNFTNNRIRKRNRKKLCYGLVSF